MSNVPPGSPLEATLACCFAAAAGIACAALVGAAAIVPAPPVVVPFVVAIGIGCPLALQGELRGSPPAGRAPGRRARRRRDLIRLRRDLDRLPEVEHPLEL